jgi:hypothetical protein
MFQLHEPTRTLAAGMRRVAHPNSADTFELAVTELVSGGSVRWLYGSTHGLHSAPLIGGGVLGVTAMTSWGARLAVGGWYSGPAGGGSFVTFRNQDGSPLPAGQGAIVPFANNIIRLEPAPNGMLAVIHTHPGEYADMLLIRSDLTLDSAPPVRVSPPSRDLVLPDGSRVSVNIKIDPAPFPSASLWLTRLLPNGTVDPVFGGHSPQTPVAGSWINFTDFNGTTVTNAEVSGLFIHPAGGYLACVVARRLFPGDSLATPLGLLVTRWNGSGSPSTAWGSAGAVEHPGVAIVNQVTADDPAGLVVVGSELPSTAKDGHIPTLRRIRYSDGQLDPTFGKQGVLSVSLRHGESRMARRIVTRPDGTMFVPITSSDTAIREPEDLIWIEIA